MMNRYIVLCATSVLWSVLICEGYDVSVVRLNDGKPIITSDHSSYRYNYNAAYLPLSGSDFSYGLYVRVQNLTNDPKSIYDVGPSLVALSRSKDGIHFTGITEEDVVMSPGFAEYQHFGVEDPRVVYVEKLKQYFMFYTAVEKDKSGAIRAQLALSITSDPKSPDEWKMIGPLFPDVSWSKSGALLVRDSPPHLLLWGDNSICVAETSDLEKYNRTEKCPIETRADFFDSLLVESGPPPMLLSDGNYLFLYNSARKGEYPNPKPGWDVEYNLGYVILDGKDPSKVIYRSSEPILSPEKDWEKCVDDNPVGLTPWVIFVEGWKRLGDDKFLVYYQGCDSFLGVAELTIRV